MGDNNKNIKKGFTLIELLVVIAIIGILSGIGLVSLNGAREKARDAKRISDLRQYASALNIFYDNNGHYPCCSPRFDDSSPSDPNQFLNGRNEYDEHYCPFNSLNSQGGLLNGGILAIPLIDPMNDNSDPSVENRYFYHYVVSQDFQSYRLLTNFESRGNTSVEQDDGGFCSRQYEMIVGELCDTCSSRYNCFPSDLDGAAGGDYPGCPACPIFWNY
ncbi:MAG: type II secretion system protein [bacterium]